MLNHQLVARQSRKLFGVRGLVRAFGRRLVAVECEQACNARGPLDAALHWRQVAKAARAVTSHRTPNFRHRRELSGGVSNILLNHHLVAGVPPASQLE